ncbi:RHH-type rel operon transcriptional repressor/antitoxin RelB [Arthrobacter roseus]|nr:RHH-type rel operon transcriptional repressor/antitoxin RelB [Arthrobacter roseus]
MTVAVRLTVEQQDRLDALAARTGRSRSFYVKEAIEQHLDELEERYWADEVVARYEASDKKTRPWNDVKAEPDL